MKKGANFMPESRVFRRPEGHMHLIRGQKAGQYFMREAGEAGRLYLHAFLQDLELGIK